MDFLLRAFQVAYNSIGRSDPNPSVGAVLVYKDKIIGEGATSYYNGNHAEVNAIMQAKKKYGIHILVKSHLYVTLEPCCHHGSTPPCTDFIIQHGIPKVTVAYKDPSSRIHGRGLKILRENCIQTELVYPHKYLHEKHYTLEPFFHAIHYNKPKIILKWAQTQNGYLSPKFGSSGNLINPSSLMLMHKIRELYKAILVTPGTIATDFPKLTSRYEEHKLPSHLLSANKKENYFQMLSNRDAYSQQEKDYLCHRYFMLPSFSDKFTLSAFHSFIQMQKKLGGRFSFFTVDSEQAKILEKNFLHYMEFNNYDDLNPIFKKILNDGNLQVMIEAGPTYAQELIDHYKIDTLIIFIGSKQQKWGNRSKGRSFSYSKKIKEIIEDKKKKIDLFHVTSKMQIENDLIYILTRDSK